MRAISGLALLFFAASCSNGSNDCRLPQNPHVRADFDPDDPDACLWSCDEGWATCGGSPCSIDLLHDPRNCGQCGSACPSDACWDYAPWGGVCPPTTIAAGLGIVNGLAVHGASATPYWTRFLGGRVDVMTTADGGVHSIASVPAGGDLPPTLVVSDDSIYFTDGIADGGSIYVVGLDGGTPALFAGSQSGVAELATDGAPGGSLLYWSNNASGQVMAAPLAGGAPVPLVSGRDHPRWLVAGASHLYWIDEGDGGSVNELWDGGVRTISSGLHPQSLGIWESSDFWTSAAGTLSDDGSPIESGFATNVWQLVVDDSITAFGTLPSAGQIRFYNDNNARHPNGTLPVGGSPTSLALGSGVWFLDTSDGGSLRHFSTP
jgi:hypothetical protein